MSNGELPHILTEAIARGWIELQPSRTPFGKPEIPQQFRGPHEGDDLRPWYRVDVKTPEELVVALEVQPSNVRATYAQVNPDGTRTPILEST